jgi:hypothetical protein
MLTSDKLTPLIKDLERVEHDLALLEKSFEVTIESDGGEGDVYYPTSIFGKLMFRGGSIELNEEITKRMMKDLHSILKVQAKNLQDDIAKKFNRGK